MKVFHRVLLAVGVIAGSSACSRTLRDFTKDTNEATGGATGKGGEGGDSDSGARNESRLTLGSSCEASSECQSEHCVDGVCCESACDGACTACGGDGKCDVMPEDDPECGVIPCADDTECLDYDDGEITERRCAAFGTCKLPTDCPVTPRPARTKCSSSDGAICDGQGACVDRTVACGSTPECPVEPGRCCSDQSDLSVTCQAAEDTCSTTQADARVTRIACLATAQCPLGEVCCFLSPGVAIANNSTSCVAADTCVSSTGFGRHPVCHPDNQNQDCPGGATECNAYASLPDGYGLCL